MKVVVISVSCIIRMGIIYILQYEGSGNICILYYEGGSNICIL